MELTYTILTLLHNTFIGTLLAGSILGYIGLILYHRQKEIDFKYDDQRRVRSFASKLFAEIEIATGKYQGQLNIYNGNNPQIRFLSDELNKNSGNQFKSKFDSELNDMSLRITEASDDLVAQLKISGKYNDDIEAITKGLPGLNIYLIGSSVFHISTPEQIQEYQKAFYKTQESIQGVLKKIINEY